MGYNNRALRLRDAARAVMERHGGVIPQSMDELQALPGIGHYTAAAIRNFAFGMSTPCLDTNIRRVLHRAFIGPERADGTWPTDDRALLGLAERALRAAEDAFAVLSDELPNAGAPGAEWHAALMDFGSLVCTKRAPRWDVCPLTEAGLMRAAYKVPSFKRVPKAEPGRMIAGRFVPNRIVRGRIVEALREHPRGLTVGAIGSAACIDWHPEEHRVWLMSLLTGLQRDGIVAKQRARYLLATGDVDQALRGATVSAEAQSR